MATQTGSSAIANRQDRTAWHDDGRQFGVLAQNMAGRYLAIGIDILIGLVLLPYNVAHLGKPEYGLWMLVASVTTYASLLELGYGGALTSKSRGTEPCAIRSPSTRSSAPRWRSTPSSG